MLRCIDADKFEIELINHMILGMPEFNVGIAEAIKIVKKMPTADMKEARHGRWIRNDNGTYSCSECQSWIPNEQHYYARYCLYCGAIMDKEE